MNTEQLRAIIDRWVSLHPEDDFGTEKCWKEMTEILSNDISATIDYFERQCTDEEFFWLSAIFEDVSEKTQSVELIKVLRERLARVKPETYHQQDFRSEHMKKWVDYSEYVRSIEKEIDYAENRLAVSNDSMKCSRPEQRTRIRMTNQ